MRRKLIIAFEVILIVAAVSAVVFILKHPDRHDDKTTGGNPSQQTAYVKQVLACQRYTLADAKQLLGKDANASTSPIYDSSGANLYTSSCTYTTQAIPGQTNTRKTSSTLLMRQPKSDKGTLSNQNEFGSLVPATAIPITGYGDKAFWDPTHGELNILKGNIWYVLSIGPATPADRGLDQAKSMADLLLPKL